MNEAKYKQFCREYMMQKNRLVPARLQAALALLERLRDHPFLVLASHQAPGSSGMESHETYGDKAHVRFGLDPINKNHGRRSSQLAMWGQQLLDVVGPELDHDREQRITEIQAYFAGSLKAILETEPFTARIKGRTAESTIEDLLQQAAERGNAGAVAQYLVGAKLRLRFPSIDVPAHPYNKGDRKRLGDQSARLADFQIAETAVEVALGFPDSKHIEQVELALDGSDVEFWLITSSDCVSLWRKVADGLEGGLGQRVAVYSVASFVGQNVSELGTLSSQGKGEQLNELFRIYNSEWVEKLGPAGLRILVK